MGGNGKQQEAPDEGTAAAVFVDAKGKPEPLYFSGFTRIQPSQFSLRIGEPLKEVAEEREVHTLAELGDFEHDVVVGKFRPHPGFVTQFVAMVATWHGRLRRL